MSNKERCAFENLMPTSSTTFQQEKPDSKPMTEARPVTHYELDARLSATEARMDARIDRIEAVAEVIRKGYEEMREEMKALRTDVKTETNSAKREFRAISFGLLLAMLTTVFAVMQINSSLISGTVAAMQHGVATSEQTQDMRKTMEATVSEVRDMRKTMEATISEVRDMRKELAAARGLKNQASRNN